MAWRGTVSRSLMSAARASAFRPSTPLSAPPRVRPSSIPSARLNSRRFSFSNPSLKHDRFEWTRKQSKHQKEARVSKNLTNQTRTFLLRVHYTNQTCT